MEDRPFGTGKRDDERPDGRWTIDDTMDDDNITCKLLENVT
jgi:hypothetical protein